ncbi:MAG TPA: hypothetical protein PLU22_25735, partial [Polyangiaceae bacterium]|nr:hypothetical protein [Polyangiaceae bacterium]
MRIRDRYRDRRALAKFRGDRAGMAVDRGASRGRGGARLFPRAAMWHARPVGGATSDRGTHAAAADRRVARGRPGRATAAAAVLGRAALGGACSKPAPPGERAIASAAVAAASAQAA